MVFYALGLISKKPVFVLSHGLNIIINIVIQVYFAIYPLYLVWQIIISRQWLFLFLFIILGRFIVGIYQIITAFFVVPFGLITTYFSDKLENKISQIKQEEDTVEGEILDEDENIVGVTEADSKISIRMAKYFLLNYCFLLSYMVMFPSEKVLISWFYYIIEPFFEIVIFTIFFGLFYSLFNKIKNKRFFPEDKRYWFIKVWKVTLFLNFIAFILMILF
ncbi:MAG: hypothetical protein ABIJ43_04830 [Candidatus Beckwithbacteria bacterium]